MAMFLHTVSKDQMLNADNIFFKMQGGNFKLSCLIRVILMFSGYVEHVNEIRTLTITLTMIQHRQATEHSSEVIR